MKIGNKKQYCDCTAVAAVESFLEAVPLNKIDGSIPQDYVPPDKKWLVRDFVEYTQIYNPEPSVIAKGENAVLEELMLLWCTSVLTTIAKNPAERKAEMHLGNICFFNSDCVSKMLGCNFIGRDLLAVNRFPSWNVIRKASRGWCVLFYAPPYNSRQIHELFVEHVGDPKMKFEFAEVKKEIRRGERVYNDGQLTPKWHLVNISAPESEFGLAHMLGTVLMKMRYKEIVGTGEDTEAQLAEAKNLA